MSPITLFQYVGVHLHSPDWTPERQANTAELLTRVTALQLHMENLGVKFPLNPVTGTCISGWTFGGFRPQNCPAGAPKSTHKDGKGLDIYDPAGDIDYWIVTNRESLEPFQLWFESPANTPKWSHWQSVAPHSGNRIFIP